MVKKKERYQLFAHNFSKKLSEWQKNGQTLDDFAEAVGAKDRQSVSNWKNGKSYPSKKLMSAICRVLNTTEDFLTSSHSHTDTYQYDCNFTEQFHHEMSVYCSGIGINSNFLQFIKEGIPDEEFPVYAPIKLTSAGYERMQNAPAFKGQKTNEYQRTVSGKTVNLSKADYHFILDLQNEVTEYIRYLYHKRKKEMISELQTVQEKTTHIVQGVRIFDAIDDEGLSEFDRYYQFVKKGE